MNRERLPAGERRCAGGCGKVVTGRMRHCDDCGRWCANGCGRRAAALDRALCHPCEFEAELEAEARELHWYKNRHGVFVAVRN